jgi:hypothetical protein
VAAAKVGVDDDETLGVPDRLGSVLCAWLLWTCETGLGGGRGGAGPAVLGDAGGGGVGATALEWPGAGEEV